MTPVSSTYRLQFHRAFTLRDALRIVPYLADLGVSHIYASPLLAARCGSQHGYDVCDPTRINPEIGTEAELRELVGALRARGMGLVLDIVPNHMSASLENPWWWDVLEHGRASRYAAYFDIDWEASDPVSRGRVSIPILGDEFERVLGRGELRVFNEPRGLLLGYFEHRLPISPESIQGFGLHEARRLAELNDNPEMLARFLEQQHYRLLFWRRGDQVLNYRRFFNITELTGVRVEAPEVFAATHLRVLEWLRGGLADGLRVDHPDGLYDPERYLEDLRREAPAAWLVIEKILTDSETLPPRWPVQGTTGYDFLNRLAGIFVDPAGEPALTRFYTEFTGQEREFEAEAVEKKRMVLRGLFAAEVSRLLRSLQTLLEEQQHGFDESQARQALVELAASFEVYRTYVRVEDGAADAIDLRYISQAVVRAQARRPELGRMLALLADVLSLRARGHGASEFVMRFQQLTGPAMAKGVEDTAFYCFNRFVMLNEVGGNPGAFGLTPAAFHDACVQSSRQWPLSMLASSTHDTKRSEDVRARLALLSEIPDAWISAVRRWSAMLEKYRSEKLPDRNAEYLLYQTLVGAWPLPYERAWAYMQKATREAKEHTSWSDPNPAYESALGLFTQGALRDRDFLADLEGFVAPLVEPAQLNSLAQTLVKLTAPGVPDTYQGTELWDLSLVDPDNRRPVDFVLRSRLLDQVRGLSAETAWQRRAEGLPKLWLIWRILSFRAQRPEALGPNSGYEPLAAEGSRAQNVLAFMRNAEVVSVVPRLVLGLGAGWDDTALVLPVGLWQNELTREVVRGGRVPIGELLARFPVALLSRVQD